MAELGVRLAEVGYAVIGMAIEGHGRSKGPRCYISSFHHVIQDHRYL